MRAYKRETQEVGKMPLGSSDMHYYAQREAIQQGPRAFNVNGEIRLAYGLNKSEVKRLFMKHGYNTTTGSRWRSTLMEWKDPELFGDFITVDGKTLMNKRETTDWSVLFVRLTKSEQISLLLASEKEGILALPREQRAELTVCL